MTAIATVALFCLALFLGSHAQTQEPTTTIILTDTVVLPSQGTIDDTAAGTNTNDDGEQPPGGATNSTRKVAAFEEAYLQYMLDHHYIGIRAASECLNSNRNLRPQLVQLCRYLNATERAQYEILDDLLFFYYGRRHQPSLDTLFDTSELDNEALNEDSNITTDSNMRNYSKSAEFWRQQLLDLQNTTDDDEFSMKFLRWLLVYQGSGIVASVPCAQSSFHKELIDYCVSEITSKGALIGQERALLCAWHDVCQVELTDDEVAAQKEALDFVTLGLGGVAGEKEEEPQETEVFTGTNIGTVLETEVQGTSVVDGSEDTNQI